MLTDTQIAELVKSLKEEKLNITWEDEITNKKLISIVKDAEIILNHKLGAEIDYSAPGLSHNLFLNYGAYAFNDCTDEFDTRYRSEIIQIRNINQVENYRLEVLNDTEA